jgi:REP element-mobilizing transposase RayT
VVEQAVREVCTNRGYWLRAINVRTNHVHTVVSAAIKPEPILQAFQAYATRELRRAGLLLTSMPSISLGEVSRNLAIESE